MAKYHLNSKTGAVGRCIAKPGNCRFMEYDGHFDSKEEAVARLKEIHANFRKKAKPSKRGGQKESLSDARNAFKRAALDKVLGTDKPLRSSWREAVILFHGCCYLCGERVYDDEGNPLPGSEIQADHIVPPSSGGTISAGNMAPAHRSCNDEKGDQDVEDFLMDRGRPDLLKTVTLFQKMYDYEPPALEVFQELNTQLDKIWEAQEMILTGLQTIYQMQAQVREVTFFGS